MGYENEISGFCLVLLDVECLFPTKLLGSVPQAMSHKVFAFVLLLSLGLVEGWLMAGFGAANSKAKVVLKPKRYEGPRVFHAQYRVRRRFVGDGRVSPELHKS